MTLKSVHLVNIQDHADNVFEFPEFGVIRISGTNSAGKSAVFKPLIYLMNNKIAKPGTRAGLVSRGKPFGEATYARNDGVSITIHIAIQAASTWVSISKPGLDTIKRYLSDKNYRELLWAFGVHYNENRGISINYASGDGPILFFSDSPRTNGEILEIALTDQSAQTALDTMTSTLKVAQDARDKAMSSIPILEDSIKSLEVYDIEEVTKRQHLLCDYFNVLSTIYFPEIPQIRPVPNVTVPSLHFPEIPEIRAVPNVHVPELRFPSIPEIVYPDIYDFHCDIPEIVPITEEIEMLKNGVCPTCGRGFADVL